MKYPILLLFIILASCSQPKKDIKNITVAPLPPKAEIQANKYKIHDTLSITGDFDGDGKQDVLTSFIADSTGQPVKQILDGMTNEWDSLLVYCDRHSLSAQLKMNNKNTGIDTGVSFDLFCLINMGNVNGNKGDEIAFVPVLRDYSNMNSCHIYSLCKGKWVMVKRFGVHEGAFYYKKDEKPHPFTEIEGYLEKHNGKWIYKDFYEDPHGEYEMQELIVPSCQK